MHTIQRPALPDPNTVSGLLYQHAPSATLAGSVCLPAIAFLPARWALTIGLLVIALSLVELVLTPPHRPCPEQQPHTDRHRSPGHPHPVG
jgi:hypothetical protein